eukprot:gene14035-5610_t
MRPQPAVLPGTEVIIKDVTEVIIKDVTEVIIKDVTEVIIKDVTERWGAAPGAVLRLAQPAAA